MATTQLGLVFLVGAGPGDPGLMTVRGREVLEDCDCVVYDYLVNAELLALAPAHADRHFVGKRGHETSVTQEEINRLLVDLARTHRRVVRLKGGDPFLFGRGGEEAAALAAHHVPFEIVPGVTSGIAVPAYAGIPVTHRAASSAVAFCTGHERPGKESQLDWAALAKIETLVLYMGMHKLGEICAALVQHGKPVETPVAVIQWGTLPQQRVVEGTLASIAARAQAAGMGAPAITVIGDVVRQREALRWFDNRPLSGRTVLVTRSREQAGSLSRRLRDTGARVVEYAVNRQEAPSDWLALDAACDRLGGVDWVVFTSANAARFTLNRLRERGRDARVFGNVRIAAVGPATDDTLRARGLTADLVPATFSGETLAAELLQAHRERGTGKPLRVLLPQADNANPRLKEHLAQAGAEVVAVLAYRNVAQQPPIDLATQRIDALTFASSATVDRFVAALGQPALDGLISAGARCYAIGPDTADALRRNGLPVAAVADQSTLAALVDQVICDLGTEAAPAAPASP